MKEKGESLIESSVIFNHLVTMSNNLSHQRAFLRVIYINLSCNMKEKRSKGVFDRKHVYIRILSLGLGINFRSFPGTFMDCGIFSRTLFARKSS